MPASAAGARRAGSAGRAADPQQRPDQDHNVDAPGANDDGSGTVLSMELARVFAESGIEFDATLVFMTVAGEEQGLIGAGAHAKKANDEKIPIQAWFNNDIVGNSHGGDGSVDSATIRVYSEGPGGLDVTRAGAVHPARRRPVCSVASRPADGASGPFQPRQRSQRAQRTGLHRDRLPRVEENYAKQHGADDTIDGVDFHYLAQNARVNAAGMATLALAPPPPAVVNTARRRPRSIAARPAMTRTCGG